MVETRKHFKALVAFATLLSVVAALSLAAVPGAATADLITYRLSGAVTSVTGPFALPISNGDPVYERFTVDTSLLNDNNITDDPNDTFGQYLNAIISWTVTIGSTTLTGTGGNVLIFNGPNAYAPGYPFIVPGRDTVRFEGRNWAASSIGGTTITNVTGNVYDPSAVILTDDTFPRTLDPTRFAASDGRVALLWLA